MSGGTLAGGSARNQNPEAARPVPKPAKPVTKPANIAPDNKRLSECASVQDGSFQALSALMILLSVKSLVINFAIATGNARSSLIRI